MVKTNGGLAIGALAVVAVLLAVAFIGGQQVPFLQQIAPGTTGTTAPIKIVTEPSACDPASTNAPAILFSVDNAENSSFEPLIATARFYEINPDGTESYINQVDSVADADGLQAIGSGFACDCGVKYKAYIASSDGTRIGGIFDAACVTNRNTYEWAIAQHGNLITRVYDEEARAFTYTEGNTSAGGWAGNGANYYNTTGNSTPSAGATGVGQILGQDDSYDYSIYFKTDAAVAPDRRFTDSNFIIAVNTSDTTQWAEPSTFAVDGATATKLTDVPSRLGSSNYDWAWEITKDGKPLVVTDSEQRLHIVHGPTSATNPSTSISIGFFTKGWYVSNVGQVMKNDYAQDDSARTYVFAVRDIVLRFS